MRRAAGGGRWPSSSGLSLTFLLSIIGGGELLRHLGLGGTTLRDLGIAVLVIAGVAAIVPSIAQRLERPLAALSRLGPRRAGDGFWSGLVVGAALGFVYAPCAGPVLAAVVSVSAVTGKTVAVALAYVAGSALVLGAIALGGRRVLEPLRRAGPLRVQRALGAVMLATALAFIVGLDTRFETALARHTSSATLTGGLESSGAVKDRLRDLRGAPKFDSDSKQAKAQVATAPKSSLPDLGAAPDFTGTQRWFNSRPLVAQGAARPRRADRLLDLHLHQLPAHAALPGGLGQALPLRGADDRRRPRARVRLRARRRQRPARDREQRHQVPGRPGQRPRHLERLRQPVLAGRVPDRRRGPGARDALRRGRLRQDGVRDPLAAGRARREDQRKALSRPKGVTPVGLQTTPETYIGAARAQGFVGTAPKAGTTTYKLPDSAPPLNSFALGGTWKIGDEPATAQAGATLAATVQARFVYLVLSPPSPSRPGAVNVSVDGKAPRRITVDTQRLYTLASFATGGRHGLRLTFSPGTSAYAFTFG